MYSSIFFQNVAFILGWHKIEYSLYSRHKNDYTCAVRMLTMSIYTPSQQSCREYICFTPSVYPSVRPTSRVHSVAPTVLVVSILYLYILSSNFTRCVACKVSCKILNFEFLAICSKNNFDCVLFWLGIWCESLVWVIVGQRELSECRHSSCSCYLLCQWHTFTFPILRYRWGG